MTVRPLLEPRDGLPEVAHTAAGFAQAAKQLGAGRGPIAIDTERASDFRFDDRAFLVQLRRKDSGTLLLAPETDRAAFTSALAPVLCGQDRVLHAAASDLPALSQLGLRPGTVFDTELSGRLLGLPRVNLAALTAEILGVGLEKGHGNEDWSTWPLPHSWLVYAALDVEVLLELGEALAELLDAAHKLTWLEQECDYLVDHVSLPEPCWTEFKGMRGLRSAQHVVVAKALWERRQEVARAADRAPHRILSNKALLQIATTQPAAVSEIRSLMGRRAKNATARRIKTTIAQALQTPKETWPRLPKRDYNEVPAPRGMWAASFPEAHEALQAIRAELAILSEDVSCPVENLIQPAMLREVIWHSVITRKITSSSALFAAMKAIGVRQWQRELAGPIVAHELF